MLGRSEPNMVIFHPNLIPIHQESPTNESNPSNARLTIAINGGIAVTDYVDGLVNG